MHGREGDELAELLDGEGCLEGASSADDVDVADSALRESFESVGGDVSFGESGDWREQDAGYVEGDVALADDRCGFAGGELRIQVTVFGEAIVPAYEGAGRIDSLEGAFFAKDGELFVLGGAVREEDGIVVGSYRWEGKGVTKCDVADEGESGILGHLGESLLTVL